MESFNVLCYLCGESNFAPLTAFVIKAGNEASARFKAFQLGAQKIIAVQKL